MTAPIHVDTSITTPVVVTSISDGLSDAIPRRLLDSLPPAADVLIDTEGARIPRGTFCKLFSYYLIPSALFNAFIQRFPQLTTTLRSLHKKCGQENGMLSHAVPALVYLPVCAQLLIQTYGYGSNF